MKKKDYLLLYTIELQLFVVRENSKKSLNPAQVKSGNRLYSVAQRNVKNKTNVGKCPKLALAILIWFDFDFCTRWLFEHIWLRCIHILFWCRLLSWLSRTKKTTLLRNFRPEAAGWLRLYCHNEIVSKNCNMTVKYRKCMNWYYFSDKSPPPISCYKYN